MSSLYQPTPTEEAYGIYLLEEIFGKSRVQNFSLTSKEALSLLEKSGVNRLFLRNIWAVADPDNTKRLTDLGQFYAILRLVALAQDGLLEQEISRAFDQRRGQTTPSEVMQQCLWMSSDYTDCPLPTFEGIQIPSVEFLKKLHQQYKNQQQTSHAALTPVPAPMPLRKPPTTTRSPAHKNRVKPPLPMTKPRSRTPRQSSNASEATEKPAPARIMGRGDRQNYESAIHQLESVSMDATNPTVTNVDSMKDLDPVSFELIQEQAALQRAILESKSPTQTQRPSPKEQNKLPSLSEEDEALQKALLESSQSPPRPAALKKPPPPAAQAEATPIVFPPMPSRKPQNWLRMRSLTEFDGAMDRGDDSDDSNKGNATDDTDENFLKTQQQSPVDTVEAAPKKPPPPPALLTPVKQGSETVEGEDADQEATMEEQAAIEASLQSYYASDRKPAAGQATSKPHSTATAATPDTKKHSFPSKLDTKQSTSEAPKPPQRTKSDSRVDEYPQAVQELVMNGFELDKAIQGYKMLGDNFDDIVLFLTSDMTVKELVINGFNIRKVVEAYEVLGDNMDELIAYLMQDSS